MIILRERTEFQDNLHFSQVELWLQKSKYLFLGGREILSPPPLKTQ